ncbi:MAG: leucine-rich repeat protein [Prevotella sp.]|nr:leucine-rich repeat protein [Prevotella sp.]
MTSLSSKFNSNTLIERFDELKLFTSVTVLDTVFNSCTSLQHVNFENIILITNSVCRYSALKHVYLPRVTTFSGYYMFCNCPQLETVILDNLYIQNSSQQTFRDCPKHKWTVWRTDKEYVTTHSSHWNGSTGGKIYVNDDMYDYFKSLKTSSGTAITSISNKVHKLSEFATDYPDIVLPEKVEV